MFTNMTIQNHGFIPPKEIKPEEYIFGGKELGSGLPAIVIREDGQWLDFLPKKEIQRKNGFESLNCTNYGTLNCLEIYLKAVYEEDNDFAERYSGVVTGTTKNGNSPHNVIEKIRKYFGCIAEHYLPFDKTINSWNKYYSPKPMAQKYLDLGKKWLDTYEVKHEWVFFSYTPDKHERLKQALKYSPIGISVKAWKYRNGKYFKNKGETDNHWCCCVGYKEGDYWIIYDSYSKDIKHLEWGYDFQFAKRYYINKNKEEKIKNMTISNNDLITPYGEGKNKPVYLVRGDYKYWITSEEDAEVFNYFGREARDKFWADVKEVNNEDLEKFKTKLVGDFNISTILQRIFGGLITTK